MRRYNKTFLYRSKHRKYINLYKIIKYGNTLINKKLGGFFIWVEKIEE